MSKEIEETISEIKTRFKTNKYIVHHIEFSNIDKILFDKLEQHIKSQQAKLDKIKDELSNIHMDTISRQTLLDIIKEDKE